LQEKTNLLTLYNTISDLSSTFLAIAHNFSRFLNIEFLIALESSQYAGYYNVAPEIGGQFLILLKLLHSLTTA
jgi:hypothetical protein